MTMGESADVAVIGMGPGGEDVAGRLAEAGLDVIGIDAELVGVVSHPGDRPLDVDYVVRPGRLWAEAIVDVETHPAECRQVIEQWDALLET